MTNASQNPATASGNTDLALLGSVLNLDEPAVLALGGGVSFMAATFQYQQVTTLTFVFRAHPVPFVEAVLEGSGLGAFLITTTSAAKAHRELSAALEAGDRLLAYVSIPGENWGEAVLQEITSESKFELAKATKKKQYWLARIDQTDHQEPVTVSADAYRDAVRLSAQRMLNELQPEGVPESFAKNFGVSGICKLSNALTDSSARGWAKLFEDPARRATGFGMALKFLNGTAHGGRGGLRHTFAEVVERAGDAPDTYRSLGYKWEEFAGLMSEAQMSAAQEIEGQAASSYSKFLETAAGLLTEIADAEEAAAKDVLNNVSA